MVLVRRIDTEATALQRHGELGIWAQLLGQEAAQVGAGRALRPQDFVFPTYREHGVAWCRGLDPLQAARALPRRRPRQLGPRRVRLRSLHDRHRRADPARDRLRDGHAARRRRRHRRPGPRRGRGRALRRRRVEPGRRQRGVHLRGVVQRPGRVLLPEQPVGDLRADRAAEPDPALPARARLRLPRRARRRQRRARDVRRHAGRAAARPRRPGPDVRRGLHLPDGRAHHDRRPDPLPALRRRRELEAQGPDRPGRGLPEAQRPRRHRLLRGDRGRGRPARRHAARGLQGDAGPAAAEHVRPRVRRADRRAASPSATGSRRTSSASRGRAHDRHQKITLAKGLNMGLRKAMEDDAKVLDHGRGRRQARRRLPDHRRPAEGLRRGPGHRLAAGRVRHRRHRGRHGDARLPAGRARSSSTGSSTRPTTRSSARSPRSSTAARAGSRCRS